MNTLSFKFNTMILEIEHMKSLSKKFITNNSSAIVLPQWKEKLQQFQGNPFSNFCWSIPEDRPIKTILSNGEYQPNCGGGRSFFATISAVWEISAKRKPKKLRPDNFVLTGNASTLIRVYSVLGGEDNQLVAEWRFEIGDANSPGCFFHNQINWELPDLQDGCSELDVPRLPTILVTPMDALEFVLGEFFQDRWPRHAMSNSGRIPHWSKIQRQRLLNVLAWKYRTIENARGSPWTSMKLEKPSEDELLGNPPRFI